MTRVTIWQGISHNCYGCFPRGLIKISNIYSLRHWGRVAHICVGILSIIGLDNGLSPGRRQPIIWTNTGKLLMGSLGKKLQWNFNQNSYIFIIRNAFENIVWKMAAILSQCLNVLRSRTHTSWMTICLEQRLLCGEWGTGWLKDFTPCILWFVWHIFLHESYYFHSIVVNMKSQRLENPSRHSRWGSDSRSETGHHQGPLLLTWINFNPSKDK